MTASDTPELAEAKARARGLHDAAEIDGLELTLLRDAAPSSWWSERYASAGELRASLWPAVREQLEELLP